MAKRALSYRLRLFKGKRPLAQNKLRYATSFEVWYGKRRVIPRSEFPKRAVRVAQRRELLGSLVKRIELRRLKILKKQRDQRRRINAAKKQIITKKKAEIRLRREPALIHDEYREAYIRQLKEADKSLPVFEQVHAVEPTVTKFNSVKDTLIIPVAPEGIEFSKQIIDKEMRTNAWGDYHIATLDFSLNEDFFIPMTGENFEEAYREAMKLMLPHVVRYFEETKRSSNYFIFRIKFLNNWRPEDEYEPMGISFYRMEIRDQKGIINLFRDTFRQMFGEERFGLTSKGFIRRNYLEGDKLVFIKGFTLEATAIDKERTG